MHYISFMFRYILIALIFLLLPLESFAMLEFRGKVSELLNSKNCDSITSDRLGQRSTKVVYTYTCLKNENLLEGLIECDVFGCEFLNDGE